MAISARDGRAEEGMERRERDALTGVGCTDADGDVGVGKGQNGIMQEETGLYLKGLCPF